jgi:hypothetical protein
LTDNPLRFHLADGSLLEGCQLFSASDDNVLFDTEELMRDIDWQQVNVNITKEYGVCTPPSRSIHGWLCDELIASEATIVFYDHRSGECADYLTISVDAEGQPIIRLYHCKKAGGAASRERVGDLYEVCGQATKSVQWRNKKRLIRQVKSRLKTGSVFYKGDLKSFLEIVEPDPRYEFLWKSMLSNPAYRRADCPRECQRCWRRQVEASYQWGASGCV